MTKLIAEKDFSPDGSRKLKIGEEFEMSDSAARLLVATRRAKYKEPITEPLKPNRYKRKDMRAEE